MALTQRGRSRSAWWRRGRRAGGPRVHGEHPGPIEDIVDVVAGRPTLPSPEGPRRRGPARSSGPRGEGREHPRRVSARGSRTRRRDTRRPWRAASPVRRALPVHRDAGRVGPVRAKDDGPRSCSSSQDQPILGLGSASEVTSALEEADLLQLTETSGNVAYERDDARSAPHNLFVATRPLFGLATKAGSISPFRRHSSATARTFPLPASVARPRRSRSPVRTWSSGTGTELGGSGSWTARRCSRRAARRSRPTTSRSRRSSSRNPTSST